MGTNSAELRVGGSGPTRSAKLIMNKSQPGVDTDAITFRTNGVQSGVINYDGNTTFFLAPEEPANWQTKEETYEEQITGPLGQVERTVTRTREVKEYVGATLSVKDELIALRDRAAQQDQLIEQLTVRLAALES